MHGSFGVPWNELVNKLEGLDCLFTILDGAQQETQLMRRKALATERFICSLVQCGETIKTVSSTDTQHVTASPYRSPIYHNFSLKYQEVGKCMAPLIIMAVDHGAGGWLVSDFKNE